MRKSFVLLLVLILASSSTLVFLPVNSQFQGNITINANGSITPSTGPIQQMGNTYTLAGNISGTVQVQKSNIIIDGAGYAVGAGIDLSNGIAHDPTRPRIVNVTIENLYILNGAIATNGGSNDTFYNDYISNYMGGSAVFLLGTPYSNITYCTLNAPNSTSGAIEMIEGSGFTSITENNIIGGIHVFLSASLTVDRNYWSDYLTKYPNATEIDNSGVGDTPYVYYVAEDVAPNGTRIFTYYQDSHPLMKPVPITVPEFPSWITLAMVMIAGLLALVYFRKRKR